MPPSPPRFRVDTFTTDDEILEAIRHLGDTSRRYEADDTKKYASPASRECNAIARDNLHDDMERLTLILARRKAREATQTPAAQVNH